MAPGQLQLKKHLMKSIGSLCNIYSFAQPIKYEYPRSSKNRISIEGQIHIKPDEGTVYCLCVVIGLLLLTLIVILGVDSEDSALQVGIFIDFSFVQKSIEIRR